MGQNKSKGPSLAGSDRGSVGEQDPGSLKPKKSKQRKWRKSKGYSLSASLESDLHCNDEDRLVTRGTPKNGLVLVSYNVTDQENKRQCTGRRNSYHPESPHNEFADEKDDTEWDDGEDKPLAMAEPEDKAPPMAEPEGDLSCYSTPVRTLIVGPARASSTTPSPITITTHADVVIVPAPSLQLPDTHHNSVLPDSVSVDSFVSVERSEIETDTEALQENRPESSSLLVQEEKPSVTFAEPEDLVVGDIKICDLCSGQEAEVPGQENKKTSVVVANHQSRVSVPVPSNISNILESGLAQVSFLELPSPVGSEGDESLHVIVRPPLIFLEQESSSDLFHHSNSQLRSIVKTGSPQNVDQGSDLGCGETACQTVDSETDHLPTDAAICPPPLPLAMESGPGCQDSEEEEGSQHEIILDARGESRLAETITVNKVEIGNSGEELGGSADNEKLELRENSDTPVPEEKGMQAHSTDMKVKICGTEETEEEDDEDVFEGEEEATRYMTVNQLRKMFLRPAFNSPESPEIVPHKNDVGGRGKITTIWPENEAKIPETQLSHGESRLSAEKQSSACNESKDSPQSSKYGDIQPEAVSGTIPSIISRFGGSVKSGHKKELGERAGRALVCQGDDASVGLLKQEDASLKLLNGGSELSEIVIECDDDTIGGRQGNELRIASIRGGKHANTNLEEKEKAKSVANDDGKEGDGVPENARLSVVRQSVASQGEQAGGRRLELAGGEEREQEEADKSCNRSEGGSEQTVGMQEKEEDPGNYVTENKARGGIDEMCLVRSIGISGMNEESLGSRQDPRARDEFPIPPSCDIDGISSAENSDLDRIGNCLETGGIYQGRPTSGSEAFNHNTQTASHITQTSLSTTQTSNSANEAPNSSTPTPGSNTQTLITPTASSISRRARVVSFSLDLTNCEDDSATQKSLKDDDGSSSPTDLSDSLCDEDTPLVTTSLPETYVEEEQQDAATLSDISPITDFATLPELPVEEEWMSLTQEAARATEQLPMDLESCGGRLPGLEGEWGVVITAQSGPDSSTHYANEGEDLTIADDNTDVSFSLPTDPGKPTDPPCQEELVDSCLDLTSPTPSQSTSTDSRGSWQQFALAQSGYTTRLPPQGCSGSSEEDEGAEVGDSAEECYDSLEDLKRGAGIRRLPAVPGRAPPARRDLARSQTFAVSQEWGVAGRRKLPQIPPRAVSVTGREEQFGMKEEPRGRRAVSVGRELPRPVGGRRSRLDRQHFEDKSLSPETSLDSGCHSFEQYGEETSVDPPSLERALLPRRNQSNFLWVDFQAEAEKPTVVRRPKNHDRLTQSKKSQNRHSAPPGSLDTAQQLVSLPQPKRSVPGRSNSRTQVTGYSANMKRSQSAQGQHGPGRIHSAVVSGINVETKSVTVEWFERGETKGKEIELEQILGLNQDLAPTNYENANTIPNKLKYVPRPAVQTENNKKAATTTGVNAGNKRNPGRQSHVITSNGHGKNDVEKEQNGGHVQLEPMAPPKAIPALKEIARDETVSKATANAAQGVNRRRSNVVKEVERLKENREKRRAQQAQILEDQELLRNKDPGNPNWEFLQMILDYKEQLEFNPLVDGDPMSTHQITVCIRKRPMSQKEIKRKDVDVVTVPSKDQITIHEPKTKVDLTKYLENQHFRFDCAFDETASNEMVYKYTARSLVQSIFEGGMATCFAYGQTGSGKTHTMGGEFHGKSQDSKNGIYAFATRDVFKLLKSPKYKNNNLLVSCSYFEIYSGKVFDLLSGKSKLRVLEDGKQQVVVVGLTETEVDCVEDVLKLITQGNNQRTSGQTSANAHSSRSHAVFQIILRTGTGRKPLFGKFSLIDLAGNERGADTSSANRQTRMEGAEINKSLLALKECIRALGRKGAHLPFRASKLTQVLRDSFIGDKARTCMIAMISPSVSSCEHTLNTLRYADRVKELGVGRKSERAGNSLDYEQEDDLLGESMGDLDSDHGRMEDGVLSPEDSDLAQLRSLNDGECSADWYNFQESVAHLQALEEEVVESHKNLLDSMEHWIQQDASLLAMTNEVDYDQDAYAQQLEDMIAEKQEQLATLRERTRAFRECLADEEIQSNKMNQNRRH